MESNTNGNKDGSSQLYDEDVSGKDAEQLRKIIKDNDSIWAIAIKSFELGQKH